VTSAGIDLSGPYDLYASLRAAAEFSPLESERYTEPDIAVRVQGKPLVMRVDQPDPGTLTAKTRADVEPEALADTAGWILMADLDLGPFYGLVRGDDVLGPVTRELEGLKFLRPASLFEMGVIAVTEQQISRAAAHRVRNRLVERFGRRRGGRTWFPTPHGLARAGLDELTGVGLSRRKAEYVKGFALAVERGELDLDALKDMDNHEVVETLSALRGFGRWSGEYLLVRGLGRTDAVPADDLGVRDVAGRYLGPGRRVGAERARKALERYAPYQGLAVYYLFIHDMRRRAGGRDQDSR
jgi:DNA-3-methyladenine glycosylase II